MKPILIARMECTVGTSNKFWFGSIIKLDRTNYEMYANYGPIGSSGQTSQKKFSTVYGAFNALLSKLKEKQRKGYIFTTPTIGTWKDSYEPDLKVAASRFFASAKMIPGWIDSPGISDFVKGLPQKDEKRAVVPLSTSHIKSILEERKRTAQIII